MRALVLVCLLCFVGLIAISPTGGTRMDLEDHGDEAMADLMYEDGDEADLQHDKRAALPNLGGFRRLPETSKRSPMHPAVYFRPPLADYLNMAQLEMELQRASGAGGSDAEAESEALPERRLAVDKRRNAKKNGRRYGFWVTAINKMDNDNLKGFLGKHRNIYNVYKRGTPFVRALANTPQM